LKVKRSYKTELVQSASYKHEHDPDPDREQRDKIAQFFLEVFRHQLGGDHKSPSSCYPFKQKSSKANNYIYELRVQTEGSWKSRRMSIGRIGEKSASKAKCFFVIYDEYIVIKIPPRKITKIDDYINILKKEKRIVEKIEMQECIIPTVSVILKYIHNLKKNSGVSLHESEDEYIKLASMSVQLQKYLKLGDQFVFFMDLSKYYFLQQAIDSIHSIEDRLYREAIIQAEIAWDLLEIEHRYGKDIVPFFIEIKNKYIEFESQFKAILEEHGHGSGFNPYQIKLWFFKRLFEYKPKDKLPKSPGISKQISALENKILGAIKPTITSYRTIIKDTIYQKSFYQNKAVMEGITVNLLKLLAHLKEVGVALRDLKPDNLLVAGKENQEYPLFLLDHNNYKIGFIDVETAVIFDNINITNIEQPQLGGTPLYITPSHFFNNKVLTLAFGDLAKTFHLQDWHAIIGIIYKLVTGETLFANTVFQVPAIINFIKKSKQKGKKLSSILIEASKYFWSHASNEFNQKLAGKEKMLKSTSFEVPDEARMLLLQYNSSLIENLTEKIRNHIASPKISNKSDYRQSLFESSPEKISSLIIRLQKNPKTAANQSKEQYNSLKFLRKLEELKLKQRHQKELMDLISHPKSAISIFTLLHIMFQVVTQHMYRDEWKRDE